MIKQIEIARVNPNGTIDEIIVTLNSCAMCS